MISLVRQTIAILKKMRVMMMMNRLRTLIGAENNNISTQIPSLTSMKHGIHFMIMIGGLERNKKHKKRLFKRELKS